MDRSGWADMTANPLPPQAPVSALAAALERWSKAALRLGLPSPAAAAGALLLGGELDDATYRRLVETSTGAVAPRRADLLRLLQTEHGEDGAALALAALEERGVAAQLPTYAGPWIKAEMELDRRVRAHCLGAAPPPVPLSALPHPLPRVEGALAHAAARCAREAGGLLVVVRGRAGSGRDFALRRILGSLGLPAIRRGPHELRQPSDPFEPELSGAAAVWDPRRTDPSPDDYDIARRWLARSTTAAFALLDRHQDAPDVDDRIQILVDVDPLDATERRQGWEAALLQRPIASRPVVDAAVAELGHRSRAGAGLAYRAAAMIDGQPARDGGGLVDAVEQALAALVRPSTLKGILTEHPTIPLDRVIAPPDTREALRQIVLLAQLSAAVETPGRVGVKALFSGPSGTGKTMAARAIATALRLPLYRVDLASVVSKWVGETEKNLREALSAAEAAGAVLLFDEGDALFGKRGEVSKGADRYANMEVSYLLQAVEAYDGIAVVTTNARGNVDSAFERRFDACVEFQPPQPPERAAIWRQELGEAGRGLPDALIEELAKRADLHGGSIAAAARVARVLCLHGGRAAVAEPDLREAVRIELLKSGSSVQAARWNKVER
jgi:AAA+ superfamily predicted ATPase